MKILSKRVAVVGLLMLVGLLFLPVFVIQAQDEGPAVADVAVTDAAPPILVIPSEEIPNDANVPLLYGAVGVMGALLTGAMAYSSYIMRFLAKLVPPETASAIYASGVRFGLQVALNHAAQTPSPLDDEFFTEMARLRGLQVVRRIDGTYEVTQNLAPTPPIMP